MAKSWIWKLIRVVQCMTVFASIYAPAQTGADYAAGTVLQMQATFQQLATPDSAATPTTPIINGQVNLQTAFRKPAQARAYKNPLTRDTTLGKSTNLCFAPGIGWQILPSSSAEITRKQSGEPLPSGRSGPYGAGMNSAAGANPSAAYAHPSEAKRSNSTDCPGELRNTIAQGFILGNGTSGHPSQETTSVPAMALNSWVPDWLQAGSQLNSENSGPPQRLMGLIAMPAGNLDISEERSAMVSGDRINDTISHAYISSIKLRRMIRNAPDWRTRHQLQEVQDHLVRKPSPTPVASKGGTATNETLKQRQHKRSSYSPSSSKRGDGTRHAGSIQPFALARIRGKN